MDNSDKEPVRPIIAEDYDGPPGFCFAVCPSSRVMVDYKETPCSFCGQKLIWGKKKAAHD